MTEAGEKLAAINLSEDDLRAMMERHKDRLRKALATLAIYGRYDLTSDQSAILTVPNEPRLTGSWIATDNSNAGAKFFGEDMALTDTGIIIPATFKIDPTTSPKTIDIAFLIKQADGKQRMLGIFEVDGDTLCGFGKPAPRRIFLRAGPCDGRQSGGMGKPRRMLFMGGRQSPFRQFVKGGGEARAGVSDAAILAGEGGG